jgi:hypothetical protein
MKGHHNHNLIKKSAISYNSPGIRDTREQRRLSPNPQYLKAATRAGVPKAKPRPAAQRECS